MQGVIANKSKPEYAFIRTPEKDYFVWIDDMPIDSVGRRYLKPGEWVSFDIVTHEKRGVVAKNLKLLTERQPVPFNYRETGTVSHVDGKGFYCSIKRPSPDSTLYFHFSSARTEPSFKVGQVWNYAIAPPKSGYRRWEAIDCVEVIPDIESAAA